jgi:anti-sigma B factor antagonist
MARFQATTSAASGRAVVSLTGECDLEGREALTGALLAAVGRANLVCVDLGGVTFLDSSGVHSLVAAHHAARDAGGRLYVMNARGAVATVLDITGVGDLLSPADIDVAAMHGPEDPRDE